MKNQQGFTVIEALFAIITILGVGGWIANIFKLINGNLALAEWTAVEILRLIGIFVPPLGSVMGFL